MVLAMNSTSPPPPRTSENSPSLCRYQCRLAEATHLAIARPDHHPSLTRSFKNRLVQRNRPRPWENAIGGGRRGVFGAHGGRGAGKSAGRVWLERGDQVLIAAISGSTP